VLVPRWGACRSIHAFHAHPRKAGTDPAVTRPRATGVCPESFSRDAQEICNASTNTWRGAGNGEAVCFFPNAKGMGFFRNAEGMRLPPNGAIRAFCNTDRRLSSGRAKGRSLGQNARNARRSPRIIRPNNAKPRRAGRNGLRQTIVRRQRHAMHLPPLRGFGMGVVRSRGGTTRSACLAPGYDLSPLRGSGRYTMWAKPRPPFLSPLDSCLRRNDDGNCQRLWLACPVGHALP
jgi:hypothetical protein